VCACCPPFLPIRPRDPHLRNEMGPWSSSSASNATGPQMSRRPARRATGLREVASLKAGRNCPRPAVPSRATMEMPLRAACRALIQPATLVNAAKCGHQQLNTSHRVTRPGPSLANPRVAQSIYPSPSTRGHNDVAAKTSAKTHVDAANVPPVEQSLRKIIHAMTGPCLLRWSRSACTNVSNQETCHARRPLPAGLHDRFAELI